MPTWAAPPTFTESEQQPRKLRKLSAPLNTHTRPLHEGVREPGNAEAKQLTRSDDDADCTTDADVGADRNSPTMPADSA